MGFLGLGFHGFDNLVFVPEGGNIYISENEIGGGGVDLCDPLVDLLPII